MNEDRLDDGAGEHGDDRVNDDEFVLEFGDEDSVGADLGAAAGSAPDGPQGGPTPEDVASSSEGPVVGSLPGDSESLGREAAALFGLAAPMDDAASPQSAEPFDLGAAFDGPAGPEASAELDAPGPVDRSPDTLNAWTAEGAEQDPVGQEPVEQGQNVPFDVEPTLDSAGEEPLSVLDEGAPFELVDDSVGGLASGDVNEPSAFDVNDGPAFDDGADAFDVPVESGAGLGLRPLGAPEDRAESEQSDDESANGELAAGEPSTGDSLSDQAATADLDIDDADAPAFGERPADLAFEAFELSESPENADAFSISPNEDGFDDGDTLSEEIHFVSEDVDAAKDEAPDLESGGAAFDLTPGDVALDGGGDFDEAPFEILDAGPLSEADLSDEEAFNDMSMEDASLSNLAFELEAQESEDALDDFDIEPVGDDAGIEASAPFQLVGEDDPAEAHGPEDLFGAEAPELDGLTPEPVGLSMPDEAAAGSDDLLDGFDELESFDIVGSPSIEDGFDDGMPGAVEDGDVAPQGASDDMLFADERSDVAPASAFGADLGPTFGDRDDFDMPDLDFVEAEQAEVAETNSGIVDSTEGDGVTDAFEVDLSEDDFGDDGFLDAHEDEGWREDAAEPAAEADGFAEPQVANPLDAFGETEEPVAAPVEADDWSALAPQADPMDDAAGPVRDGLSDDWDTGSEPVEDEYDPIYGDAEAAQEGYEEVEQQGQVLDGGFAAAQQDREHSPADFAEHEAAYASVPAGPEVTGMAVAERAPRSALRWVATVAALLPIAIAGVIVFAKPDLIMRYIDSKRGAPEPVLVDRIAIVRPAVMAPALAELPQVALVGTVPVPVEVDGNGSGATDRPLDEGAKPKEQGSLANGEPSVGDGGGAAIDPSDPGVGDGRTAIGEPDVGGGDNSDPNPGETTPRPTQSEQGDPGVAVVPEGAGQLNNPGDPVVAVTDGNSGDDGGEAGRGEVQPPQPSRTRTEDQPVATVVKLPGREQPVPGEHVVQTVPAGDPSAGGAAGKNGEANAPLEYLAVGDLLVARDPGLGAEPDLPKMVAGLKAGRLAFVRLHNGSFFTGAVVRLQPQSISIAQDTGVLTFEYGMLRDVAPLAEADLSEVNATQQGFVRLNNRSRLFGAMLRNPDRSVTLKDSEGGTITVPEWQIQSVGGETTGGVALVRDEDGDTWLRERARRRLNQSGSSASAPR